MPVPLSPNARVYGAQDEGRRHLSWTTTKDFVTSSELPKSEPCNSSERRAASRH